MHVASVPATHVYVRRLQHPDVVRLEDPSGDDLRTPCFLDPGWWSERSDPPDLLHVHFGFEFYDPGQIRELADVLDEHEIPLVYTAHDLRNPNHRTPDLQDAGLAVLLERADALVTLTASAADEVERRCGCRPVVLPHPHVAPLDRIEAARCRSGETRDAYRLLLHFKSLRPNMVAAPLLEAAADVARDDDELSLEVRLHCDVVSPRGDNHDPELVALACDLADEGLVDLGVHPYLDDESLWDLVESVDGFVLPYRFGTHSGLLELCRDLGTAVIAPSCGSYADQGAQWVFESDEEHGFDPASFRSALRSAVAAGPPPPLAADARARQRRQVAAEYVRLYRRCLGARRIRATS